MGASPATAVGTVFGIGTQSATFLGFSTAPKYGPIRMTRSQFIRTVKITNESFKIFTQKATCHYGTYMIMDQPYMMKCCKHLGKHGQKYMLQNQIKKNNKCLICQTPISKTLLSQSQLDQKEVNKMLQEKDYKGILEFLLEWDQELYTYILGYRQRVLKTYYSIDENQKPIWKQLFQSAFGKQDFKDNIQSWKNQIQSWKLTNKELNSSRK